MVFSRGWLTGLRKLNKLKSKRGDVSPLFIKAGSALTANHTASVFCARCRGSDRVPERLWFGYGGCISIRFPAGELPLRSLPCLRRRFRAGHRGFENSFSSLAPLRRAATGERVRKKCHPLMGAVA